VVSLAPLLYGGGGVGFVGLGLVLVGLAIDCALCGWVALSLFGYVLLGYGWGG